MSLLEVRNLTVAFGRRPSAVRGVSFTVDAGARVGLIGESGCGKTVTSLAIMGLLAENAHLSGSILLNGTELVGLRDRDFARLRGDQVGMVFQEPLTALDPTMRCGRQVAEVLRLHHGADGGEARERVLDMLTRVGFDDPHRIADAFPHELSGGQRQRIVIAMALINSPALVICDEPTTALDVTVQATVLELLRGILDAAGAACLFISHDLAVVAQVCDEVLVMLDGEIVERRTASEIFTSPQHPYTKGLVATARLDLVEPGTTLPVVEDFYTPDGAP